MTETKTLNRDTPTQNPNDTSAEKKRPFDLSASQLAGGALAAMTSAVIGAQLGVAGTIIGAAIGSLVAGVAGAVYTASLKRTKDKITSVIVGHGDDTTIEAPTVTDTTVVLNGWDTTPLPAADGKSHQPVVADPVTAESDTRRRLPWKGILVSAAAVFALAIAGITAFELVSGHAISGGEGTTIAQVNEGRSGSDSPSESSSVDTQASTESSSSTSASSEPSASATSETTSSTEASSEPTQSSASTSSSEPTASSSQSAESAESTTDGN